MILIENSITGERQCVERIDGYDEDWAQVGPELPEESHVDDLALIEGAWITSPQRARDLRWEAAKDYREQRRNAPLRVAGVVLDDVIVADCDLESRLTIAGAVQMATIAQAASEPYSLTFTDHDNRQHTLSASQVIALGVSVAVFQGLCHAASQAVRQALDDAVAAGASAGDIGNIDITAGYPDPLGPGEPPEEPES